MSGSGDPPPWLEDREHACAKLGVSVEAAREAREALYELDARAQAVHDRFHPNEILVPPRTAKRIAARVRKANDVRAKLNGTVAVRRFRLRANGQVEEL